MVRRKVDVPKRISIMIPSDVLTEVDQWKQDIEDVSRSELISKLVRYALNQRAVDILYPDIKPAQSNPQITSNQISSLKEGSDLNPRTEVSLRADSAGINLERLPKDELLHASNLTERGMKEPMRVIAGPADGLATSWGSYQGENQSPSMDFAASSGPVMNRKELLERMNRLQQRVEHL